MPKTPDNQALDAFRDAAQSLKLYRRAELIGDNGAELIEALYVDPLPNEHVLQTMLKPNTTFLVGRKGTGKSTVFQRAQYELRKRSDVATAYVDIKSVFESSRVDGAALASAESFQGVLSQDALERFLLNRQFVSTIIGSIREEIEKRVKTKLWERVKLKFGGTMGELFRGLDKLTAEAATVRYESIVGAYVQSKRSRAEGVNSHESNLHIGAQAAASVSPQADLEASLSSTKSRTSTKEEEFEQADILMRVFDLREYITELKKILELCGIKHLYVFLDDFSELPEPAMRVVVDALIAPLNNWSDELIKFKIAAYPTRIYYGEIDKTKTDEINLDLFNLYGTSDLVAMEEKAVDFTRRLILRRLEHFGAVPAGRYFDGASGDELWRQLFFATMANPRNLGWLLYFAYESALLYGKIIGSGVIRDAARRYYEEKIAAAFEMNKFLNESFEERSSIFSLKDLLDSLVAKARSLRNSDVSILRELEGRAPSSHFHISVDRESLLNSLELNFFVTKYYVMSDRDGNKVAVYSLNYGLCQARTIEFGRPRGTREKRYRQYYAERVFDYTPLLDAYVRTNQEITCDSCGARQDVEQLSALRAYGMLCPVCRVGTCTVINLSRKYETVLRSVSDSSLLPAVELGILQALDSEGRPLNPSDVAEELDCSYQLVGRRAKNLDERGLIQRNQDASSRRVYVPTDLARSVYFNAAGETD
ncbi:methyltransferase family protein [Plantibacter sp. CFBP 13570]|uniref:methyltransferase family protein n=1 Tax=Plantibacter sp. CFBP 13570 TaxID=2775272 RepID=UPI0019308BFC|nr:MarR family transcriptional regulator [Plantibacter sp. CFBP 13570]MBD8534911.1 MarR family transcriptional regulator [Plantibacter sp. CFBP 13570]